MKRYIAIGKATVEISVEIAARNEDEAWDLAQDMMEDREIDLDTIEQVEVTDLYEVPVETVDNAYDERND